MKVSSAKSIRRTAESQRLSARRQRRAGAAGIESGPPPAIIVPSKRLNLILDAIGRATMHKRSAGPEGTKRIITRWTRHRLETFLPNEASPATIEYIQHLLSSFKGKNQELARATLLKAIAARLPILQKGPVPLAELDALADQMRSMSDDDILRHSTVLDLDSRASTTGSNPMILWHKRGRIYVPDEDETPTNMDGLYQRFTASCGPTDIQMVLCENDPALAFSVHEEGLTSESVHDKAAAFQRKLLEKYGGIAVGRRASFTRARLNNATGRLELAGVITEAEKNSFKAYLDGGRQTAASKRVLEALRHRFDGLPTKDELAELRRHGPVPKRDAGIDTDALLDGLNTYVTPVTGVEYESSNPKEGFARGQSWRYLDRVESALRLGVEVPFGIEEPAHWMLLTHVKGKKPNRSFLVSDPDGGRTAWVREKDFVKGIFADKQFALCEEWERAYVTGFALPILD